MTLFPPSALWEFILRIELSDLVFLSSHKQLVWKSFPSKLQNRLPLWNPSRVLRLYRIAFFFLLISIRPTHSLNSWLHQYSLHYLEKKKLEKKQFVMSRLITAKDGREEGQYIRAGAQVLKRAWLLPLESLLCKWCDGVCVVLAVSQQRNPVKCRFWALPRLIYAVLENPLFRKWELRRPPPYCPVITPQKLTAEPEDWWGFVNFRWRIQKT